MYSFASYSPGKQTTISKSQQEQEKAEAIKREMQRRVEHLQQLADFDKELETIY